MQAIKETNREDLTLVEWLCVAGLGYKIYDSMFHENCVFNAAHDAWKRGEDPTEYRNDHSSLESHYNSKYGLWIRGLGDNPN